MPNDWFQFKQFLVRQDRCAMKVGTDGVLLGAWCAVEKCRHVLDVGTGTGLIALMCAQRSKAEITAIEIDPASAKQAEENFGLSKWKNRITIVDEDFRYTKRLHTSRFDLVVCNPPFFTESIISPRPERNIVRHEISLKLSELISVSVSLLSQEGRISLILPASRFDEAQRISAVYGLKLARKTLVLPRESAKPLRVLAEWSFAESETVESRIILHQDKTSEYHPDFSNLTHNFYLDRIKGFDSS